VKDEAAGGVEVDGRGGRKLGAVHAGGTQPGGQAGGISSAVHVDLAGEVAAPALIIAQQQARELAQLRVAPIIRVLTCQLRSDRRLPGAPTHCSVK